MSASTRPADPAPAPIALPSSPATELHGLALVARLEALVAVAPTGPDAGS